MPPFSLKMRRGRKFPSDLRSPSTFTPVAYRLDAFRINYRKGDLIGTYVYLAFQKPFRESPSSGTSHSRSRAAASRHGSILLAAGRRLFFAWSPDSRFLMRERSIPSPRRLSAPEAYRFVDDLTISYLPLYEYSSWSLATRSPSPLSSKQKGAVK